MHHWELAAPVSATFSNLRSESTSRKEEPESELVWVGLVLVEGDGATEQVKVKGNEILTV